MILFLLLPAYNEAENLAAMRAPLERLVVKAEEFGVSVRVVVVDDGSTDQTRQVALDLPHAQVIVHEGNKGLAEALRSLVRYFVESGSTDDVGVILDADNTMDLDLAMPLVNAVRGGSADIAIASRFAEGGGQAGVPVHRAILSIGASILFRLIARVPRVRDYTCGYRAYSQSALTKLVEAHAPVFDAPGFSASVELLLRLHRLGCRFVEIPLGLRYDQKIGASKIRVWRTLGEYARLVGNDARGFTWVGTAGSREGRVA